MPEWITIRRRAAQDGPRKPTLTPALMLCAAASVVACAGCLRLPETAPEADPAATDRASLREMTDLVDLGTCTENGWSGHVRTDAGKSLEVKIGVTFMGFGSDALGRGATTVAVEPGTPSAFSVVPDPPINDLVLSCSIEIASITLRN